MNFMNPDFPKIHSVGNNIRRLRKLRELSQQDLAKILGISRQAVGSLEQSFMVDDDKLKKVADALGFSVNAIENFSEDQSVFQIQHMTDHAQAIYHFNSNPLEKIIELSDRLLQTEKEKFDLLQEVIKVKNDQIEALKKLLDSIHNKGE